MNENIWLAHVRVGAKVLVMFRVDELRHIN